MFYILVTLLTLTTVSLIFCIKFLYKQQKDLVRQLLEQKTQFTNLASYVKNLALSIKDIQDFLLKKESVTKKSSPFFKTPHGEA